MQNEGHNCAPNQNQLFLYFDLDSPKCFVALNHGELYYWNEENRCQQKTKKLKFLTFKIK